MSLQQRDTMTMIYQLIYGYTVIYKDIDDNLYIEALTYKKYDRLEYLGDAILSCVIAEYLYVRYPNESDGFLSKMRTHLVNGKFLTLLSNKISLDNYIIGIDRINVTDHIREDLFESFLGAMFINHEYNVTKRWIINFYEKHVDFALFASKQDTDKAVLNRYSREIYGVLPELQYLGIKNDVHFTRLTVNNSVISVGRGNTRNKSEDRAMSDAIFVLKKRGNI